MIPVKLSLSNFTSYGASPPELNFTKFKLAAISGYNGAGKSSLLDAITWCVWGASRAGDSADALVHLGAESMQVEFTFELEGHLFTIKRRRIKKGGGSTALELWSNSHNLTEGTIKATQEKIINTLHLTFETFTNSSYIRQGHADEFTTKGPSDRKRILADILGLSHYDHLEEKAKEKSKEAHTKLELLSYQLLEIEAELSQKEEREKSLSLAEEERKKVESDLKDVEIMIKDIEGQKQEIASNIKSLEDKKIQLEVIQKELLDLKLQIDLKEKAKEEYQTILNQKSEIEKNYQTLEKLQQDKKLLENKRSELIKIKDQLAEVQRTLMLREEKRAKTIKELAIEIKKFETENETLQDQIKHLTEHKTTCPTCKQTIDDVKNKEILQDNSKKIESNEKKIQELQSKIETYQKVVLPEKKEAASLENQIKVLEEETKSWFEISQEISNLERYANFFIKLQQAETALKAHTEAVLDLQKIYSSKQKQINQSETELKGLGIYEIKLKDIREKLTAQEEIKQVLSQKALELSGLVGEAKQLVSRTQQLENLQKERGAEKNKLQKEKEVFEELSLAFGKKGIQAMIIEGAIPEIENEANSLLEKLTEGRMKVSLQTQRETKTLRPSGSGQAKEHGIVETLDIIISDEMGERAYEMYSGGEAFRVNFAIRLAISKLLTHRAGAKLQFLVIDEGFGSQDAPGRARLVESIDAIKDDFEKILLITHIEELKEEFPVRIEVSKNSTGSTFEVVGI
ncbi:SMC family ATPase [Candidatus Daviesbacteria bacterium]|nr:SMC family ATPase [Candidatus Daviesbacteria bacterium]